MAAAALPQSPLPPNTQRSAQPAEERGQRRHEQPEQTKVFFARFVTSGQAGRGELVLLFKQTHYLCQTDVDQREDPAERPEMRPNTYIKLLHSHRAREKEHDTRRDSRV